MELLVKGHYSSSVPANVCSVGPGRCDRLQVCLDSQAGTSVGGWGNHGRLLSQLDG